MERVREMKKNSDIVTHSAQKEFNQERSEIQSQGFVEPKVTNMPPNFPESNTYPAFNSAKDIKNKKIETPCLYLFHINIIITLQQQLQEFPCTLQEFSLQDHFSSHC